MRLSVVSEWLRTVPGPKRTYLEGMHWRSPFDDRSLRDNAADVNIKTNVQRVNDATSHVKSFFGCRRLMVRQYVGNAF